MPGIYQQKVKMLVKKHSLHVGINRNPVWGTTSISLDAPEGYKIGEGLHGFVAYSDSGQLREVAWQDLYERFDVKDMEKCPKGCDCEWDADK